MKKELTPLYNLTKVRKEMNLTQEELAKLAGISRTMMCNIERGEALPSLPVAHRIAKTLKKPIEPLFFNQKVQKMNIKTS